MANILVNKNASLLEIILNRPDDGNALSLELIEELNDILESYQNDLEIKLVTLRGQGDKFFIAGGDNLFDFNLDRLVELHEATGDDIIALYDVQSRELAQLYGIATLEDGVIVDFVEKPSVPRSTLAATACWLLSSSGVSALDDFLDGGGQRDALGHFLAWRSSCATVRGIAYAGTWFDIGDPESYAAACAHFS